VRIGPVLECVADNGDGTYTAHFGYNNENAYVVTIPIGPRNRFVPGAEDRGQPTTFQPGRVVDVVQVDFNGGNLIWQLDGKSGTASSTGSPPCP
jgi:hypothetical protein